MVKKTKNQKTKNPAFPYMVRWGSAPSFKPREWDQCPKFSLCQPIASRERALDIWPCHPVDCRWCISQLGSTLSSMKLWEWLRGEKKGETEREKKRGRVLDQVRLKHRAGVVGGSLSKAGLISFLLFFFFLFFCVQLWGNCLFTWVTEVFSQQC